MGKYSDNINKILKTPFTCKDNIFADFWIKFCTMTLIMRYIYSRIPVSFKIILGLPVMSFGLKIYVIYLSFVLMAECIEVYCRYDFSSENFSFIKYFRTFFTKNILFLITGLFMHEYYLNPHGHCCFIYAMPMAVISAGYILPIFDQRIYNDIKVE